MNELKKLIELKIKELSSFRAEFKMNDAEIVIIVNEKLFEINQMFLIINIKGQKGVFYGNNEIKKFIDLDKHLDDEKDKKFKFKILENILINKKMDEFWNNAMQAIKHYSIQERPNIFTSLHKERNWNKKLGCFISYSRRAKSNQKMSDKQISHLLNWFNFDKEMILKIRDLGLIIVTTWYESKSNKQLYWRLRNKTFLN